MTRKRFDQASEPCEQVAGVVRPGRRLRMILHGEKRHAGPPQALDGLIVQIEMREFGASLERLGIDREAMVLGSDLHAVGAEVLHRVIRAVMAEAELVGFASKCETENLMA